MYFIVASEGLIPVGFAMHLLLYNKFTMPEKAKDKATQIPVQIPASFELMIWGVLLKIPKSRARKTKIAARNTIQTIMRYGLTYTNILDCIF